MLSSNNIANNVFVGSGTIIDPPCIIGKSPRGYKDGELELTIGINGHVRPFTTIYAGSVIQDNFQTGQGVSIREDNTIGNNVSIGTNSVLEFGNKIGDNSRIHTGCFMELTIIGYNVFIGPNVVFTDDPHPMGCPKYKECKRGAIIEDYARIGANSTILPGVRIGRNSLIGAGSVVVNDIPENSVAVGNPARVIKSVDDLKCSTGFFDRPYEWLIYEDKSL